MYFVIDFLFGFGPVVALGGPAWLLVLVGTVELGPVDDGLLGDVGLVDVRVVVDGLELGAAPTGGLVPSGLVGVVL